MLAMIKQKTGMDFSDYRPRTIVRRLERRMSINQFDDIDRYIQYLHEYPHEINILYKEFLIGVTKFFRDIESFEVLKEKVIPEIFEKKKVIAIEKKMFGGLGFMVDEKMCIGIYKGGLMARVDPDEIESLLKQEGAEQMIHGGRPMKGYVKVLPEGYESDKSLEFWIQKCLEFNPKAKSSKKKK